MTNTVGPWGSTSYTPSGSTSFVNSSGKTVSVPQYTQTTTYNPAEQAIFDKTTSAQNNIADIANQQTGDLKDYLNTKLNFDNGNTFQAPTSPTPAAFSYTGSDAQNDAYDLASQRILPQQQQAEQALETQLTNKGIRPGTAAWAQAMTLNTQGNNDQLNQLALTGQQQFYNEAQGTWQGNTNAQLSAEQQAYQQALGSRQQNYQEAVTNRQEPLNEISALLSGSQLSNPTSGTSATPQAQLAGEDNTGMVENNYNQQVASSNAALGGLFGLAGSAATAGIKYSDRRLKTDVEKLGTLPNGLPWYAFRYIWDAATSPLRYGLMAQDVEKVRPDAVINVGMFKAVDYARAVA